MHSLQAHHLIEYDKELVYFYKDRESTKCNLQTILSDDYLQSSNVSTNSQFSVVSVTLRVALIPSHRYDVWVAGIGRELVE